MSSLNRHAELVSASIPKTSSRVGRWTLKQVQGDDLAAPVETQKFLGISLEESVG